MATVSSSFTAVGNGSVLRVKSGDNFSYTVSNTFVGTWVLQRSEDNFASHTQVARGTSTASSVLVENTGADASYRFRCEAFTSGTVDTAMAEGSAALKVSQTFKDNNGKVVLELVEDGVRLPGNLEVVGTSTVAAGGTLNAPNITGIPTTTVGIGAKNGATVTAVENGDGVVHKTTLTLASTPVTVANTTGASFGGVKLYDFPEGRLLVLGVTASLGFVWTGEDIAQDGSGDFSLGTTITADATLDSTDVDLLPSTAMTDPFVLGVGAATASALAASAQFDGTGTAKDLNLNVIIDDADVSDGASDVVLASGTVTVHWINLGDY